MKNLKKQDPKVYKAIQGEIKRQQEGMELIASENYVSEAVLEALGTVFTNKYSEGYPKKRYYGGQEYTDVVEQLAIDRAKKLFGAEHINVQPLSGAPANMIAYSAVLQPGDKILGMDLSHGGHLTHGHPVTLSAKVYNFVGYKTGADGKIDYDALEKMAMAEKPKMILAGFSAYTRQLNYRKFQQIAKKVGAITMIDVAHIAGLIAGGAIPNPVPYFDIVTTTTHKTLRGPRGGMIMCKEKFAKAIDKATFPGFQGGPHMNNIAAKAVAFGEALKPSFKKYATQVIKNAKVLEKELKKYGFKLMFGGTDNHMVLVDVFGSKGVSGKEAEVALDKIGITLNKNMIPDDPRSPMDPSGVRIGVPAVTSRGMKEKEIEKIAKWINDAVENHKDEKRLKEIHKEVIALCKKFPLYKNLK
ncbi:MAG: Serine hydroxymethyltransferase [Candidatus Moranbacteria bacterium GW2011_GWE2_35_2-]|nr:MAG: Serine hydroxymethyltransferase [Candidatus Moranbacteria bacterium GW2011_GWE2_35_2-]KKQ22951.1 MAG: Serine hydroxymethyltransferase [Candidatus Moranbacteria bacterium GW2011_GWF2_37_11]KKQ29309.1 MAG: Serine hydroxymethyltransferase [Candidatus Moranbacteria bacterium GW2011_GWD1_37_17]KKQ30818.1 MAG: Serine hydroxymethyltransferase [Candidatus Moranbacteria bacterium GW2011_GWE1_37_24]KKQ47979.1 MAG: Serine hydroxymethyltransferase [Candidatus Moranbacteria bacterium GW2011_GWD2_37_